MALSNCSCGCGSSVEEDRTVECCVCKKPFLHSCVDVSASEKKSLKKKKGISWCCPNCNSISGDINELKSIILSLKEELLAKERSHTDETVFEELLSEMWDRNNRSQNLIIYNVNEIESNLTNERNKHDITTSQSILKYVSPDINVENLEVQRLGRFNADSERRRPLKVRLNSTQDVHHIIKKTNTLLNSPVFKNIHISLDRTKRQIDYYKKVKAELDKRKNEGETNLKIKYKKGIPTIDALN